VERHVALQFVNHCEREKVRILGCDGFERPRGDVIQGPPEDCLDLSAKEYWDYSIPELCDVVRDHIRARDGKSLSSSCRDWVTGKR
jgi:hypothetical protein